MKKKTLYINPEIIARYYYADNCSVKEIATRLNLTPWEIYRTMSRFNLKRRNFSSAGFAFYKDQPKFQPKTCVTLQEKKLKIAGIMLYWAEGTFLGNTVDFTNSNPEMIKVFLRFLREICGVHEERLRVYLYLYEDQDVNVLRKFWHDITQIPLSQFTKPFIRKGNPNLTKRNLPHGLIHIRYNDKKLLLLIKEWLDKYIIFGQVPKWLKGTDCRKCSAWQ